MGSDSASFPAAASFALFQSTLPVWGATVYKRDHWGIATFQSTLPVWGATGLPLSVYVSVSISIHAPRMGSDVQILHGFAGFLLFQSTLPVWGATV